MDRIVMHIDVNSAFLSWSAVDLINRGGKLDIRKIPCVIGYENSKRHGIILAASIPAKRLGVKVPEPIYMARRKLRSLKVVEPDYKLYEEMSNKFHNLVESYTPDVEKYSVDECFIEYGPVRKLYGNPIEFANKLKKEIKDKLGFTVNIGVGSNKLLAKMASDFEKPDKVHTLFLEEIEKMHVLPIGDLFGCGRKSSEKLVRLYIKTIGDLANYSKDKIINLLGKQGDVIWNYANGIDDSKVGFDKAKDESISKETTLSYDVFDKSDIYGILRRLVSDVSFILRKRKKYSSVIGVYAKYNDFTVKRHQRKYKKELCNEKEIYEKVIDLFDKLWVGTPIRLIGVRLSSLSDDQRVQLSLFDMENKSDDEIQNVIDNVNKKYGKRIVGSASIYKNE